MLLPIHATLVGIILHQQMARHFMLRTDQKEIPLIEPSVVRPDGKIPLQMIDRK